MRGKFHRPQNRSTITEYTEKGLPKLCRKTQQNLESPLFQAFFSTYVPDKAFSVCIKVSVFIDPACGSGSLLLKFAKVLGKDNVRQGFFGQEINLTTYNLARINMFLHLTWTSLVPCDVGDESVGGVWYVGFGGELVSGDFDGDVA